MTARAAGPPVRNRRRALAPAVRLAVATLLVATACSRSGHGANPPAPATTTAAPATSSTTSAPSTSVTSTPATSTTSLGRCTTSGLALRANGGSAATGHALAVFELRNTSSKPCRILGYPGVRVLDASGATLTDAQRAPGFILDDRPPAAVTVSAGQVAYFGVESANVCQGGGDPKPAASLRVTPPDETAALTVAATVNVCPGTPSVLVSPVRSSASDIPHH